MRPQHILTRKMKVISPWFTLVEKMIYPEDGKAAEAFHSIQQPDYISIIARTPSGKFPLIKQFRHSIETFTWEFPAGLLDPSESPSACAKRELFEEAGVTAHKLIHLGTGFADSGRLGNQVHMYYADCSEAAEGFMPEPDTSVAYFDLNTIKKMIINGKMNHQPHIGVLYMAMLKGLINASADCGSHDD